MKKLCKKLLALALVICMLSSFAIFVSAETDSKICVSVSASVLETTLQEYVSANMSSATFYQGECILSTGESGYCYIGYSDSAKAFYIQCFFPSNSSYRWCYKFDLDYVWKHRIEYVSDNVSWEIVGGFTIQFIDHFVNYGQPLDIDDLDPRCKLLFYEYNSCYYHTWIGTSGECSDCGYICPHNGFNINRDAYTAECLECGYTKIWYPFVPELVDLNLVNFSDIKHTDDGFFMLTKSLAEILTEAGITSLYDGDGEETKVNNYYDDWYIYGIETDYGCEYGLLKMREQENDGLDGDNPGVTISFVDFDYGILVDLLAFNSAYNSYNLYLNIDYITYSEDATHHSVITDYFSQTKSEAPYLIAEEYINFIVENSCVDGVIQAPNSYLTVLNNIEFYDSVIMNPFSSNDEIFSAAMMKNDALRVPTAISQYNINAGYTIYDTSTNTIHIADVNNLTEYEKYIILATHTNNVTFNSFAAEVEFHADAVNYPEAIIPSYYLRALRADMAVGEEYESGFYDDYYDLDSDIVRAQAEAHGEK